MTVKNQISWIDTHAHLTAEEYSKDLIAVLTRARDAGVHTCITIGTDLTDSRRAISLARMNQGVFAGIGIHPHEADHVPCDYLRQLEELAQQDGVVAIGEMGLDYHYNHSAPQRQRQVFAEQLTLAAQLKLPAIIHSREAFNDTLAVLADHASADQRIVFHCFSGDDSQAAELIERDCWISFAGVLTFKNAQATQQAAQAVPLEKIFIETDCPYLSPAPKRGHWPNEPAFLAHTAEKLAELKQLPLEDLAQAIEKNSRYFFRLR